MTQITCRVTAARLHVPWTGEIRKQARLTKEEKAELAVFAPYALPLLQTLLERYGKYLGGLIFFGMYWSILCDKRANIKAAAPAVQTPAPAGADAAPRSA